MISVVSSLNLALCLLFSQAVSSAPIVSEFKCEADGVYANPADCLKFIICAQGQGQDFDCPQGMSWHADRGLCDTTDLSKCSDKTAPGSSGTGSSEDVFKQHLLSLLADFKPCHAGETTPASGTTSGNGGNPGTTPSTGGGSSPDPGQGGNGSTPNTGGNSASTTIQPSTPVPPPTCPACPIPTEKVCPPMPTCPVCPTTTPTPKKPICDNGWIYNEATKSCYYVDQNPTGAWDRISQVDAQKACLKQDSNLASIHSEEENAFIYKLINGSSTTTTDFTSWIGLYRIGSGPNDFANYDGSPVDFRKFAASQLDNTGGNEYCVEYSRSAIVEFNSYWNDVNCGVWRATYVCKKPANI